MVTVFMNGLNYAPPKMELFRREPDTLDGAIEIALREEACSRQARGLSSLPDAGSHDPAEPMDLSAAQATRGRGPRGPAPRGARPRRNRCWECGQFGHVRRTCPKKGSPSGNGQPQ